MSAINASLLTIPLPAGYTSSCDGLLTLVNYATGATQSVLGASGGTSFSSNATASGVEFVFSAIVPVTV